MESENFIKNIVKDIAKTQDISDYTVSNGNHKTIGDNYFGTLLPLNVSGVRDGKAEILNVLIKSPPKNEFLRTDGPLTQMYRREIYMYTKLLPMYERLQERLNEKFEWPKCYFVRETVPEEVLILQDLRHKGYRHSDGMFFDLEHTLTAVKTLAAFHALSFGLEKTDAKAFREASQVFRGLFDDDEKIKFYVGLLKTNLLITAAGLGGDGAAVLEALSEDVMSHMRQATLHAKVKVIGHGDMWKNNILFTYKDDRPTKACLIDYQLSQLQNPAVDLLYLLATSTDRNLRRESFRTIVRAYHSTLTEFQRSFSVDDKVLYTFEDLERDLRAAAPYCVIIANSSFRNWCGLEESPQVFDKDKVCRDKVKAKGLYEGIMENLLRDFQDFGLLG